MRLILGIHLHQPVGNFESVLELSYREAYKPFIDLFQKFPSLSLVWHCSGYLFEWLIEKHPEYIEKIRLLVEKGRIEVLSGGMYEPIFTAIPTADGVEQIKRLSKLIKEKFVWTPSGAWLAERVWENGMIPVLKKGGIRYVALDDYHFACSGIPYEKLDGYFLTGDIDGPIGVFPISEELRYLIPWKRVIEVTQVFDSMNMEGKALCVMVDDAEKFGHWPGTHDWVYGEGWLEEFFSYLENNQDVVKTETFESYFSQFGPVGRVALPDSSYQEMSQWALPVEMALKQERLKERLQAEGEWDEARVFVRGGVWKNFLIKYPESNYMHKRMISLSKRIHDAGKTDTDAYEYVLKAQCNDVFWHGVFGGLYLPHLRHATYENILKSQRELDKSVLANLESINKTIIDDIDMDGEEEVVLDHDNIFLCISPKQGGAMKELSLKNKAFNLLSTIARWKEKYHLLSLSEGVVLLKNQFDRNAMINGESIAFDSFPRYSVRETLFKELPSSRALMINKAESLYSLVNKPYEIQKAGEKEVALVYRDRSIEVVKRYLPFFKGGKLLLKWEVVLKEKNFNWIGIEYNLGISGGDDPYKCLYTNKDQEKKLSLKGMHEIDETEWLCVEDKRYGFSFTVSSHTPFWLRTFPIETVSLAMDRMERTFQGISIWSFAPLMDGENEIHSTLVVEEFSE